MLAAYPVFYGYVGFQLTVSLLRRMVALSFGESSAYYYYAYTLPTFLMPLLQIWILWDIYRQVIGHTKTSRRKSFLLAIIAGVLTVPVAWGVFSIGLFHQYHSLTLFVQMVLCLLVCQKAVSARAEIDLGQNLKGILLGLSLMVGCQAINFIGFAFAQSSSQFFWFFVQFIYLVALIVFTHTLWEYRPIAYLDPSYQHRMETVNRKLYEVLKAVLLNRR
ncbi:hypothetical protein MYX65_05430 [Acidobacteria bacterium AH-259-L09]|nr:hypothetical protein [Acidobacteria bacterium AH-259-L09]